MTALQNPISFIERDFVFLYSFFETVNQSHYNFVKMFHYCLLLYHNRLYYLCELCPYQNIKN